MARDELIGRTFVELADTLVEDYDLLEFLQMLAERCVALLGVTEAGVVLGDTHGHLRPLASSSERMRLLELIEVQQSDGPCLDCWRNGQPVRADDLKAEAERWPTFAPAALDAGFASVYALPLRLREERIGALNLFGDRAGSLDVADEALGQALGDVATIGILHQRSFSERTSFADQLRSALHTRIVLEQAKGMLIAQADIDADAAFEMLRAFARSEDRHLGDVARAVTDRTLTAADIDPATRPRSSSAE